MLNNKKFSFIRTKEDNWTTRDFRKNNKFEENLGDLGFNIQRFTKL